MPAKSSCETVYYYTGAVIDNRYVVQEFLGEGGMACVYRARELHAPNPYAIKFLKPVFSNNIELIEHFGREALNMKDLAHPNIVRFYDFVHHPEYSYIAMEYIDGFSLSAVLKKLRERDELLPLDEVVRVLTQVTRGIDKIHRSNFIHRDIKPGNILIAKQDGTAIVADLGIMVDLRDENLLSLAAGTRAYMPPEQQIGENVDHTADIYSLGIVAFELFAGQRPYVAKKELKREEAENDLIRQHFESPIPLIAQFRKDLPLGLDAVLAKAIAKKPADRYQTVLEFARDIHKVVAPRLSDDLQDFSEIRPLKAEVTYVESSPQTFSPSKKGFSDFVTGLKNRLVPNNSQLPVSQKSESGSPLASPLGKQQKTNISTSVSSTKQAGGFTFTGEKQKYDIFISYSRSDTIVVQRLYNDLLARGFRIWIDIDKLQPGTPSWKRAIQQALDASGCVVAIFSPEAKSSQWVGEELAYAELQKKTIYPVLARGEENNAVPFGYSSSQWVDIRDEVKYQQALQLLIKSLHIRQGIDTSLRKASTLAFHTYHPTAMVVEEWITSSFYVFHPYAWEEVKANVELQAFNPIDYKIPLDIPEINPEGVIMVVTAPQIPGFQVTPHEVTLALYKNWHRVDFEIRALNQNIPTAQGTLNVSVEGLNVAALPLEFKLTTLSNDDLATETTSISRVAFNSVFASYSREDKSIVKRFETLFSAMDVDYLSELTSVRMSPDFTEIAHIIDHADVFQLFWSHAASQSEMVKREWECALSLVEQGKKSFNFIRPVYWEQPMPPIPLELQHFHFIYQPQLGE